jgi:hypothetical protein
MLHVPPKSLEVLCFLCILCQSCTASVFCTHPVVCVYLHIQAFSHILSALLADPSPNSLPVSYSQGFETSDRCSPEAHSNTTGLCKWSLMRGCCTTGCFRSAFRVNKMDYSASCVRNVGVTSSGFTWTKHDPQFRFSHTEPRDGTPCKSISSTIAAGCSIGLTIPDAVCTALCSWWWNAVPSHPR